MNEKNGKKIPQKERKTSMKDKMREPNCIDENPRSSYPRIISRMLPKDANPEKMAERAAKIAIESIFRGVEERLGITGVSLLNTILEDLIEELMEMDGFVSIMNAYVTNSENEKESPEDNWMFL